MYVPSIKEGRNPVEIFFAHQRQKNLEG